MITLTACRRAATSDRRDHPLAGTNYAPPFLYAMFSIMDFFPTFAHIADGKVPDDRPIDGVDQSEVLLGGNDIGHREHLLTFVGPDLVAARLATPISCREPSQTHHRWAAIPSDQPPLQRACRIVKCNVWPHSTMDANVNPLDQRSPARCKSQWRLSTDRVPSNRSTHLCLRSDRHFLPALWGSRSVRGYSQRMQP
jgi:hypothetical protein